MDFQQSEGYWGCSGLLQSPLSFPIMSHLIPPSTLRKDSQPSQLLPLTWAIAQDIPPALLTCSTAAEKEWHETSLQWTELQVWVQSHPLPGEIPHPCAYSGFPSQACVFQVILGRWLKVRKGEPWEAALDFWKQPLMGVSPPFLLPFPLPRCL